jgi:hypothetical protein
MSQPWQFASERPKRKDGKPLIGIMVAFNAAYMPLAEISLPIIRAYCLKHDYQLIQSNFMDDSEYLPEHDLKNYFDRGKIKIYQERYPMHDILCWMDIDLIIMNSDIRIEDKLGDRSFLWTYDVAGPCSGFWIARCQPDVFMTLERVQQYAQTYSNVIAKEHFFPHRVTLQIEPRGTSDQTTMRALMNIPPYSAVLGGGNCVTGKEAGHTYLYDDYGWGGYRWLGDYEPGDWMLTFPSLPIPERLEKMQHYAALAV